ncbi:MAG: hypothetical protein QXU81_00120 [Candidatus Bathyarchaeia archaeon]
MEEASIELSSLEDMDIEVSLPFAFNPRVWFESVVKHLIDITAGKGTSELVRLLDNVGFLSEELKELRERIKDNSFFFDRALAKCTKEQLNRPKAFREREIIEMLGGKCNKCGFTTLGTQILECPKCGSEIIPLYIKTIESLLERGLVPSKPEVALMDVAYDRLAQMYIDIYKSISIVLSRTAEEFNQPRFQLEPEEVRDYMDEYYLGRLVGELKIPREEKELLQFLVRGNIAGVPVELAEPAIRAAVEVLKYGYMGEALDINVSEHYREKIKQYHEIFDMLNKMIHATLSQDRIKARKSREFVEETRGEYAPCCLLVPECWQSGNLSSDLILKPIYNFPVFPKRDLGSLQVVFGKLGSGKTFLLSSIICYSVLTKKEVVFVPLNDKSNTFSLASVPLFAYNKYTTKILKYLKTRIRIKPQGLPTITLTVLKHGEAYPDPITHPPTIYDRIIRVYDHREWHVDFEDLVKQLGEIASANYGFSKPAGVICVRNLDRLSIKENLNMDVQVATQSLWLFEKYRKSHLNHGARVVVDEISYIASSQAVLYASDALRSAATISDFIKESRRNRISIDAATQRILDVLPEVRNSATNIFFRDLPSSKDKMRSEIDFMLESLQLPDENIKEVIKEINNKGKLPKYYWFWFHQPTRSISVIRPTPPTFCPQDPNLESRKILKLYEKKTGQKILLKDWSQVPVIETEEMEEKPTSITLR